MQRQTFGQGQQRAHAPGRARGRGWFRALVLVLVLVFSTGAGCGNGVPPEVAERLKPVQLVWWGVQDTGEDVQPLIDAYHSRFPHVNITYRKLRLEEYERALIDAIAEGTFEGPDIFALPSSWVRQYQSKLLPAPLTVAMPYQETRGSVKKEVYVELRDDRTPPVQTLANTFLDVVRPDAVLWTPNTKEVPSREAIYGLPLAVDTLVLYANRDLLNAVGIPEPAKTWTELQQHIPRLTKLDAAGNPAQSGVALGTARNVQRSFDILSLLMMQNGAQMAAANGAPAFHTLPPALAGQRSSVPAADALLYYTDFANPDKLVYTWSDTQPDSLEAFLQGRVAYFFGYSYHLPIITARAPRINLSVTGVPHIAAAVDPESGLLLGSDIIEGSQAVAINAANFWMLVASERTRYPNEVWSFITHVTTKPAVVEPYLVAAQRPTALRALVAKQLQDPTLRVFAHQLLTARTWYRGKNIVGAEAAFAQLMADALAGKVPVPNLLELTAQKIAQTL